MVLLPVWVPEPLGNGAGGRTGGREAARITPVVFGARWCTVPDMPDPIFSEVLKSTQQFVEGTQTRQALIAEIEKLTRRRLLVYHGTFQHQHGQMLGTDINLMVDLTDDLGDRRPPVDLMIHTPGGDANAAEQILNLVTQRGSSLRVIVPRSAKSAGTLVALGAKEIVMGVASELGPVDPQIAVVVGGIPRFIPAQSFIDSYDELIVKTHEAQAANLPAAGYGTLLQTINVAFVNEARRQIEHSKQMGARWLVKAMYPGQVDKAEEIMGKLTAANVHQSHGRMIDAQMAAHDIGLNVKILAPRTPLWRALWRLHLMNEIWMGQGIPGLPLARVKLLESRNVSLAQTGPIG